MSQQTLCLLMHEIFHQSGSLHHNVDKRRSTIRQAMVLYNALRNFVQARNQVLTNTIVYCISGQHNRIQHKVSRLCPPKISEKLHSQEYQGIIVHLNQTR